MWVQSHLLYHNQMLLHRQIPESESKVKLTRAVLQMVPCLLHFQARSSV